MSDAGTSPPARARRLLDVGVNLTLATVSAEGQPWVSPVFYVPDEGYDLYWTSERTARHSANVRTNGRAAIVVVEPDPDARVDAVYMTASVTELTVPAEIDAAIAVMARKPQPEQWTISSPGDVSGQGAWRIYRAHPESMDVRSTAHLGSQAVARRQAADFRDGDGPLSALPQKGSS